jgi:hypothetical protein
MTLSEYFNSAQGVGVLATADSAGRVDAAVYSTPRVIGDGSVAFIMRERLTHRNLQSNPWAHYLFIESGGRTSGVRLYLKKLKEDDNPALIAEMTRRHLSAEEDRALGPKHLVYFTVEKVLPLIGGGESRITAR